MRLVKNPRNLRAAEILLDCDIVNVSPEQPFVLTSGWLSPVYINVRGLLSRAHARNEIVMLLAHHIADHIGTGNVGVIAGGETAGIPFAAMVAEYFHAPMVYVRKKPKEFGMGEQIEGGAIKDASVLLIEDLATDGNSKIEFARVIRNSGGTIADTVSVFYYGVYPNVTQRLEEADLTLHYLCDWRAILEVATAQNRFSPDALANVQAFLEDPVAWSQNHKETS